MRMWMVDPRILCRQHLLGEHKELHMFVGTLRMGISIAGYIRNNCLEPRSIRSRHNALVIEMRARGYNHLSPLGIIPLLHLPSHIKDYRIDRAESLKDLLHRCEECRERARQTKLEVYI